MTMSYSIKRAELLADQLERLATQHTHQLAGQHANLQFWLSEAVAAIRTLDEYPTRYRQLRDTQLAWVREHATKITRYCPICCGPCEFGPQTPARPYRIPSEELSAARDAVRRAARRLLLRLYHAEFVTEAELREAADLVGAAVEREDLEPYR
jgi:hypothetical protein